MADCPEPSVALLELLIRRAMARGIPAQDAEDIVLRCYHKTAAAFDPKRGSFESLYVRVVDNECRFWWRTWQRREKRELKLVQDGLWEARPTEGAERAHDNQRRLLDALEDDERRVFGTWALQRHLPRGRLNAGDAAGSLGMTVREWENAKRRLKNRISSLLESWGLAPRDLFSVEDDERPRHANGS